MGDEGGGGASEVVLLQFACDAFGFPLSMRRAVSLTLPRCVTQHRQPAVRSSRRARRRSRSAPPTTRRARPRRATSWRPHPPRPPRPRRAPRGGAPSLAAARRTRRLGLQSPMPAAPPPPQGRCSHRRICWERYIVSHHEMRFRFCKRTLVFVFSLLSLPPLSARLYAAGLGTPAYFCAIDFSTARSRPGRQPRPDSAATSKAATRAAALPCARPPRQSSRRAVFKPSSGADGARGQTRRHGGRVVREEGCVCAARQQELADFQVLPASVVREARRAVQRRPPERCGVYRGDATSGARVWGTVSRRDGGARLAPVGSPPHPRHAAPTGIEPRRAATGRMRKRTWPHPARRREPNPPRLAAGARACPPSTAKWSSAPRPASSFGCHQSRVAASIATKRVTAPHRSASAYWKNVNAGEGGRPCSMPAQVRRPMAWGGEAHEALVTRRRFSSRFFQRVAAGSSRAVTRPFESTVTSAR